MVEGIIPAGSIVSLLILQRNFRSPAASHSELKLSLTGGEQVAFLCFEGRTLTRLRRTSHSQSRGFHSPAASESLSFVSSKESNQRKDDPGIRAGRTQSVLFPAVLVVHRPANNSAIPGLRQFAFPRWPPPLLGATAGEWRSRATARATRAGIGLSWSCSCRCFLPRSEGIKSRSARAPLLPLRSGGSCPEG